MAFAFNEPSTYLETNVRTVVLHELFAQEDEVGDRDIYRIVEQTAAAAWKRGIEPRVWNYALLDYGAWLKKAFPNPSRRSKHHTRQSTFEGSRRQKRAALLRLVLEQGDLSACECAEASRYDLEAVDDILGDLVSEGFLAERDGRYRIAEE
jgi:A/G-specific adenine glycosylase